MGFGVAMGQGLPQFEELGLAFLLSALIGVEREIRHKSAGLRIPGDQTAARRIVTVMLEVVGTGSISKLAARLADIDGVASVKAGDVNEHSE